MTKKQPKVKSKIQTEWNFKLLYKSPKDPQIEADIAEAEAACAAFEAKYNTTDKAFLHDHKVLLEALNDYEKLAALKDVKAILYFYSLIDIDANNKLALSNIPLIESRRTAMNNKILFFGVLVGKISKSGQKKILEDMTLSKYHVLLSRIFADGEHTLSIPEEKIMSLKAQPSHDMWIAGNEKLLNNKSLVWKGKQTPIFSAIGQIKLLKSASDRSKLSSLVINELKAVAPFSEAEINAIYTNKKINDELRGYSKPFDATVLDFRNDSKVVEELIKVVTESFPIAQKFYKIKAKLHKQKHLLYLDRNRGIGEAKGKYDFKTSATLLTDILSAIDPKYANIFNEYVAFGQIDVYPKIGKTGGAYCRSAYGMKTYVLLNHNDDLNSFKTLAHEMGHAFHSELSDHQGPIYCNYSTSSAETASTLFESIAIDAVFENLSDKEKIIVLHDRISDDISTIMRQVACFNFELELHNTIRKNGHVSHEEIADIHNKNMKAHLGPAFKLTRDDGYFFVQWSHIRRFFYVYSYAYGMLVSKGMLRRYRKDPTFWSSIEQFLKAGGNDSPENILRKIGIDLSSPEFFKEGLQDIADDIAKLEKLTKI